LLSPFLLFVAHWFHITYFHEITGQPQDCDFDDIHERGLEYVFDFVKARIRQRKSHTRDAILGLASHQLAKGTGPGRALMSDNLFLVQPLSKRSSD